MAQVDVERVIGRAGHLIAQQLIAHGETVVDVPAKLAARVRVYSTGHGRKTDRDDAISIARAAVHSRQLRAVVVGGELDALKLLTEHRHELVAARTRAACRLHRLLRELIPGGAPLELSADRAAKLLAKVHPTDPAGTMRRQIAKSHIADIRTSTGASTSSLNSSKRSSQQPGRA